MESCESRQLLSANVLTWHNDATRIGANLNESILMPTNVNKSTFGKKLSLYVDGAIYAQPLYVSGLDVNGTSHNVVYVATQHDSVYAFDSDNGELLWHVGTLSRHLNEAPVPAEDTGSDDIVPEIGITSTPVIDKDTNTMYVVAKTKRGTGSDARYLFRLWALDIATGARKFGGPVIIRASSAGNGNASQNGVISFNSLVENQRSGLALVNGTVYIAFASHGDVGPYHGWVLGYDASSLKQTVAWNAAPNGDAGGIWMAGGAPAADANGNLFINIGNGTFDADTGGVDYGESTIRVPTTGGAPFEPVDFFTPSNWPDLNAADKDFGSMGAVLLPDQSGSHPHVMLAGDKEGRIYVLDRDHLGGFNASSNNSVQDFIPDGGDGGIFSTPTYFNSRVFYASNGGHLQSFFLRNGRLAPTGQETFGTFSYPGATPSISANGADGGILWVIAQRNRHAVLEAYSPQNLHKRLYSSALSGTRDRAGLFVKFVPPTIADGKVFVGTQKELDVYGLL